MDIIDIKEYRKFYKEEVLELSESNRDENFIGTKYSDNNGKNIFGYFNITHGDKHKDSSDEKDAGIKNYLSTFLEMAKDGQAVYEFIQNAVDANSTHFGIYWNHNKDKTLDLIVINNGKKFDYESVRSILNIGASTKDDPSKIGKYGIGFKLAHRLVGNGSDSNGLDEILKLSGPIILSWNNNQLKSFIEDNVQYFPVSANFRKENEVIKYNDNASWLFKILITNFPTTLEEEIKDNNYLPVIAFRNEEIDRVHQVVKLLIEQSLLNIDDYSEGSIFFIRMGEEKEKHLKEEYLQHGIKFSLAILKAVANNQVKGIEKLFIQNNILEQVDIQTESFIIEKDSNEFNYIKFNKNVPDTELSSDEKNNKQNDIDIQIVIGYSRYYELIRSNIYEGNPNLYLYFPLSDEVHKVKFVIHCNAFSKASHRTSLHHAATNESGINERVFQLLSKKLIEKMNYWAKHDTDKFLDIYFAILMSEESRDKEKEWINKPFLEPLFGYIKNRVPVSGISENIEVIDDVQSIRIKGTNLPLNPKHFNIDICWFFFDQNPKIKEMAESKINLKKYSINDFLNNNVEINELNNLIKYNKIELDDLLGEINEFWDKELSRSEMYKNNIYSLEIFKFGDTYKSVKELSEQDNIKEMILFDKIEPIKEYLTKAEFILSKNNLSRYDKLHEYLRSSNKFNYISNFQEFNKVLSEKFRSTDFSIIDKKTIFEHIESMYQDDRASDRIKRMQLLAVFKNRAGIVMPLGKLVKNVDFAHLKFIQPDDNEIKDLDLDKYLLPDLDSALELVVFEMWNEIIEWSKGGLASVVEEFYKLIVEKAQSKHTQTTISDKNIILHKKEFIVNSDKVFYNNKLTELNKEEYKALIDLFLNVFDKILPEQKILPYLKRKPFSLNESTTETLLLPAKEVSLAKDEALLLLKSLRTLNVEIFANYTLQAVGDLFKFSEKGDFATIILDENTKELFMKLNGYLGNVNILDDDFREFVSYKDYKLIKWIYGKIVNKTDESKLWNIFFKTLYHYDSSSIIEFFTRDIKRMNISSNLQNNKELIVNLFTLIFKCEEDKIPNIISNLSFYIGNSQLKDVLQSSNNFFSFYIDNKEYRIHFKDNNYTDNAKTYQEIYNILSESNQISQEKLSIISRQNETARKDIKAEEIINSGKIVTPENLAFIALYAREKNIDYSKLVIIDNEKELNLSQNIGLNTEFTFFSEDSSLSYNFRNVAETLCLDRFNTEFASTGFSLYLYPKVNGNNLISPTMNKLNPNEELEFLSYLSERCNNITTLEYDWAEVLSFNPKEIVDSNDFCIESERLPKHVESWKESQTSHEHILKIIGCSMEDSPVVKLRKYLSGAEPNSIDLSSISNIKLLNTFSFLLEKNIEFEVKDKYKIDKIGEILKKVLDSHIPNNLLPITQKAGNIKICEISEDLIYISYATEHELKNIENSLSLADLKSKFDFDYFDNTLFNVNDELLRNYNLLSVELTSCLNPEKMNLMAIELSDTYYHDNRENINIEVYTLEYIPKNLIVNRNILLAFKSESKYEIKENKIYIRKENNVGEILKQLKHKDIMPDYTDDIDILLTALNRQHEEFSRIFTNDDFRETFPEEIEKIEQELYSLHEKKELKEFFKKTDSKFTYKWMMSFIKLLQTQNTRTQINDNSGEIVFDDFLSDAKSNRLIHLLNPNKSISTKIEEYSNFSAKIVFNDSSTDLLDIVSVSKKKQTIAVLLPNESEYKKLIPTGKKVVKLVFEYKAQIDLLAHLETAYKKLGGAKEWADNTSLKDELTQNINFIFGPPGTGKTTRLVNDIHQYINVPKFENKGNSFLNLIKLNQINNPLKVLVLCPTNKAADVVATKFLDIENRSYEIVRYGATGEDRIINEGIYKEGSTYDINDYKHKNVVFITTIHRFPYEQVKDNQSRIRICDIEWQQIYFDEASMIPLHYILFVLHQSASGNFDPDIPVTKFVVCGDPLQIPPVVELSDEDYEELNKDENIYTFIGLESFDSVEQSNIPVYGQRIENLERQYRSIESIGRLFSHFSYDGILSHERDDNQINYLPKEYFFGIDKIGIIRFPVNTSDSIYKPGKLNKSPYQIYCAILIYEIINYINNLDLEMKLNIGIICPYRSQTDLVLKLIQSINLDSNKLTVTTDTVHGFQGDECDIVFYLINPPSRSITEHKGMFLHKKFITNVAISRAKEQLVILYPDEWTERIQNLRLITQMDDSIEGILKNKLNIDLKAITIQAEEIEKKLFGKKKYIEENTLVSTHQPVNIYTSNDRKYIVNAGANAVDILINDFNKNT